MSLVKILLVCAPLFCFSLPIAAQVFLNLDFDYPHYGKPKPKKWIVRGEGYDIQLDSMIKASGKYSLMMERSEKTEQSFGTCIGNFPVGKVSGKNIVFKGKIKTEAVADGYAGLWWRVDGSAGFLGFDNMGDRGLTGTQDWTDARIEMEVDAAAVNINFGAILTGTGKAWFDAFEVWIDGEKYVDPLPRINPPTLEEIAWLKKHLIPLKSIEPDTDATDLAPLKDLIGDAKMIALGEVTHGSREIFQMKHRLIQYLAQEIGIDIFSIEANMPEAYQLNPYVHGEAGDPKQLLKGMYFWTWQTEEVLALVEWMRSYNQSASMDFTGFDMQYYKGPIKELKKALPEYNTLFDELKEQLDTVREANKKNWGKIELTEQQKAFFSEKIGKARELIDQTQLPKTKKEWLIQNTRIIEQYLEMSYRNRDKYMAENLMWIHQQNPKARMAVWAHNGHIQKSDQRMGSYLSKELGKDYFTIGFTFYEGAYTAKGADYGVNSYDAQTAFPGTYEHFFATADEPIFLLDLRTIPKDDPACAWIYQNLEFRHTGAVKTPRAFSPTALYDDFDLLIFIKKSTPSILLGY